jgi:hypothetical protein
MVRSEELLANGEALLKEWFGFFKFAARAMNCGQLTKTICGSLVVEAMPFRSQRQRTSHELFSSVLVADVQIKPAQGGESG